MAKSKIAYFCNACGYESPKWLGKCPSCQAWNSFTEELLDRTPSKVPDWKRGSSQDRRKPSIASDIRLIEATSETRMITPDAELNRVLGGGIVPGSLVLVGGEPGIGKSTLMLQIALQMQGIKVLYVSGEESAAQVKMRAERIQTTSDATCLVLTETSTKQIFVQIEEVMPDLVIIDSIQTLYSEQLEAAPGTVSQVRECAAELLRYAKETSTPIFIVGHITKDGAIAGPKVLEHMVDTVLQFEGDRHHAYRLLRAVKNRFGSASELGLYEMRGTGLREVSNPSEILLSQREGQVSGVAIAAMVEGMRPMLVEVQALVGNAAFGTAQRSSTGYDSRRLNMQLAVLEKRFGFRLSAQDVFLNIAGGLRVEDPGMDLSVAVAIVSSLQEMPIPEHTAFAGEIGLSGEIRAVMRLDQRIAEAAKLGFKTIFVSKYQLKSLENTRVSIRIEGVANLEEVLQKLFG
jgi:DNA repair protein RadA/Sms